MDSPSVGSIILLPFPFTDLSKSKIRLVSYARPSKLFTASGGIFLSMAGQLGAEKISEILRSVMGLFVFPNS